MSTPVVRVVFILAAGVVGASVVGAATVRTVTPVRGAEPLIQLMPVAVTPAPVPQIDPVHPPVRPPTRN